jgi:hypothetical protein
MKDYQSPETITSKMSRLPPSNKQEFTVKAGEDYYTVDSGLDYQTTLRTIERLKKKREQEVSKALTDEKEEEKEEEEKEEGEIDSQSTSWADSMDMEEE